MNGIVFRNPELLTSSCTLVRRGKIDFVTIFKKFFFLIQYIRLPERSSDFFRGHRKDFLL